MKLIKSIPLDTSHYDEAIETLLYTYQNNRLFAVKCLNNLHECKPVKSNDLLSIQSFSNNYEENINTLEVNINTLVQIGVSGFSPVFCYFILELDS